MSHLENVDVSNKDNHCTHAAVSTITCNHTPVICTITGRNDYLQTPWNTCRGHSRSKTSEAVGYNMTQFQSLNNSTIIVTIETIDRSGNQEQNSIPTQIQEPGELGLWL